MQLQKILIILCCTFTFLSYLPSSNASSTSCVTKEFSSLKLYQLQKKQFSVKDNAQRNELALQLSQCLAHSDPTIRDSIAFSALSQWLRNDELDTPTRSSLFHTLIDVLITTKGTSALHKSFAVLTLSELARSDRKSSFLNNNQRELLIKSTTTYIISLDDYRGFDEIIGWRHGVAHSADLFMQLSLNPQTTKSQLDQMLMALTAKITADNNHFYIYGEPRRLARATLYILYRDLHSNEELKVWFNNVSSPAPFNQWGDVYISQPGLAKLHNTRAFISELFILSQESKNKSISVIRQLAGDALTQIN
ncbi:DUF2785 domain-containing protein [Colwellia sp. D2M02]|uniref:DUF2785 domain-containing protein n=1 Tax=Colwellia sp. D2M02 TaxID=2841562 RepID=UPI001C0A1300|nr:DUF2785 domain-containing protein [Colwellia sp. D2M02]MBU2894189.1 DUF2785 domain-containing protein [Colwellia sp. D2M02]